MELFNKNFPKVDSNKIGTDILGDFHTNVLQNGHYVFQKHNLL